MKLSDFKKTLNNEISFFEFRELINHETKEYHKRLKTKGNSVPIYIDENINEFKFGRIELNVLLKAFIKKEINKIELAYLADVLTLSSNIYFENEVIQTSVESMTDPEINGSFDEKQAIQLINSFM